MQNYFNEKLNPKSKLRVRVLGDVFVKFLYMIGAISGFHITNSVLHNEFVQYGATWMSWTTLNNTNANDYMGM